MRKPSSLMLLTLLFCALVAVSWSAQVARADTQIVRVTNATKDFSLVDVIFPDISTIAIPTPNEAIEPETSADVMMAKGQSRLHLDMGMVRFVFPVADYTAGKKLTLGMVSDEVPVIHIDDGKNSVPIYGAMLNLRAADAGDEAVFQYSQFFYPATATDARDVLAMDMDDLAAGYEANMDFGDLPAKGKVTADKTEALSLELRMPFTTELLQKLPVALNTAALRLKGATLKGTSADRQWQSTGVGKADEQFLAGLGKLLQEGSKGTATLVVEYMGETQDPKARRGVLEMDFATKTVLATFQ